MTETQDPKRELPREVFEAVRRIEDIGGSISAQAYAYRETATDNPPLLAKDILRLDRKSTRLNSCHQIRSYAVFCLKKKRQNKPIALAYKCILQRLPSNSISRYSNSPAYILLNSRIPSDTVRARYSMILINRLPGHNRGWAPTCAEISS